MLTGLIAFSPLAPLILGSVLRADPVPQGATVERLGAGMGFVEGPVWVPADERLLFSDIPRSTLMQWTAEAGIAEFAPSEGANGNALDAEGHLLSCQHLARNIVRRDASTGEVLEVVASTIGSARFNSPNDLVVHRSGVIWFTDPPWGLPGQTEGRELPGNHVYRWDPKTGEVTTELTHFSMPNGIALSPDESVLYVSDTGGHRSHPDEARRTGPPTFTAYRLEDERLAGDAPLWKRETRSDGMCVDSLGRIYLTGPPGVTVWSFDGQQVGAVPVPGSTTNATFGGPENRTLFVTAGKALFCIELRAIGLRHGH